MGKILGFKLLPNGNRYGVSEISFGEGINSLNQASVAMPAGVYTTFRTYNHTKVLKFDDHISRLEHSAELVNFSLKIDKPGLRSILRDLLRKQQVDLRIRISIGLNENPEAIYIFFEPLAPIAPTIYQNGAKVVTSQIFRENPKAKLTAFINAYDGHLFLPSGVNEAIMVDRDGYLLEGLSSNFFAVREGLIYTEENKVLSGITRSIVVEEIQASGIPLVFKAVTVDELHTLDEVFITSSSREVMPVSTINEEKIGLGLPGAMTKALMRKYQTRILKELEEI